jgi:hypothetical protein
LGYFVGRAAALGREWEREKEGQQPARACGLTRKRRRWASWAERKGKGERERERDFRSFPFLKLYSNSFSNFANFT